MLPPPDENLLRLWPKLLLYRVIGAGLGELDADEAMAVSFGRDGARRAVWGSAVNDVLFRGCVKALGVVEVRPRELLGLPRELVGDGGTNDPGAGEDESEPALKGWKDTDVRL